MPRDFSKNERLVEDSVLSGKRLSRRGETLPRNAPRPRMNSALDFDEGSYCAGKRESRPTFNPVVSGRAVDR